MQVSWCLKFCNMTKSGGTIPRSKFWGDLSTPVIYAHVCVCVHVFAADDIFH